jgi:ABC-type enterochelin transport system permease subunit
MPLDPLILGINLTNARVNAYYQQTSVPLTPEQYNVIQSTAFAEANAIYAWILTATVNSIVTATITAPPNVSGTAVGVIT